MFSPQEKAYVDRHGWPGIMHISTAAAYLTLVFRAEVRGSETRPPVTPVEVRLYLIARAQASRKQDSACV
jgi:hypothetical protein